MTETIESGNSGRVARASTLLRVETGKSCIGPRGAPPPVGPRLSASIARKQTVNNGTTTRRGRVAAVRATRPPWALARSPFFAHPENNNITPACSSDAPCRPRTSKPDGGRRPPLPPRIRTGFSLRNQNSCSRGASVFDYRPRRLHAAAAHTTATVSFETIILNHNYYDCVTSRGVRHRIPR